MAVATLALGLYAVGARQTMSPGAVASPHARIDLKCGQCHAANAGIQTERCERCHDPSSSGRLRHAAHVLSVRDDRKTSDRSTSIDCAQCHIDHRGRSASLSRVSDLECGACHGFRTFKKHPEFAWATLEVKAGLKFNHERHLRELQDRRKAGCEACHEQSADRRGFQPLSFDRHCASCHQPEGTLNGETDFVPPDLVVLPGDLPASALGGSRPRIETNPRGRHKASGLRHRDEWVLFNAARLRAGIDPDGLALERARLQSQLAYLDQLRQLPGGRVVARPDRAAMIASLRAELAGLDAVTQGAASDGGSAELARMTADAETLLGSLPPAPGSASEFIDGDLDARRAELLRLLDAVSARTGAAARFRVDGLRERVLSLKAGALRSEETTRLRADRQRRLDHLLAEQAIEASPRDRDDAPSQDVSRDRADLERTMQTLRERLAGLERTPGMEPPASEAVKDARRAGLASLLTPCLKCHVLNERDSAMARPSSAAVRQSIFNHAPHTLNTSCLSCHAQARVSKSAERSIAPGVGVCETCHRSAQVSDACVTCHAYHPRSVVTLAELRP